MSNRPHPDSLNALVLAGIRNDLAAVAVLEGDDQFTFAELLVGAHLLNQELHEVPRSLPIGVLGRPSFATYVAILACCLAGRPWVPLNPKFPSKKTLAVVNRSELTTLFVERKELEIPDSGKGSQAGLNNICIPEVLQAGQFRNSERWSPETCRELLSGFGALETHEMSDLAYLMFTSGSTGEPKGVEVTRSNLLAFLDGFRQVIEFSSADRFSGFFDITFDLSVFDIFVSWSSGAAVAPLDDVSRVVPGKFINQHELTVWFSVPSMAALLADRGLLVGQSAPSLRYSLFCGEALSYAVAGSWAEFAGESALFNLYGPTEMTIACSYYEVDLSDPKLANSRETVPIGKPFPSMSVALLGEDGKFQATQVKGELAMSGPQVAKGYFLDSQRTQESFAFIDGLEGGPWYRTGDIAFREHDDSLSFVGRVDSQVQRKGFRVELGEVEQALREETGCETVVAVYVSDSQGGDIVGFVSDGCNRTAKSVIEGLRETLPGYMIPSDIFFMADFPQNSNGKIDRAGLQKKALLQKQGQKSE